MEAGSLSAAAADRVDRSPPPTPGSIPRERSFLLVGCALVLALVTPRAANAVDIHVMVCSGFSAVYDDLVPLYEKATGHHVVTARGPSTGDHAQAIPNRLASGEAADLVILVDADLDALVERRFAVDAGRVRVAKATIDVAIKEGAARPDIASVPTFVQALRNAKSIAFGDGGVYLEKTFLAKIDPDGSIRAKSRMIRDEPVGQVVARGDAELGFQQRSELQGVRGITIVGPVPADAQDATTFAAGVTTDAKEPDAARDFARFLGSRDAQPAIIRSGMEPVSATMTKAPAGGKVVRPTEGAEMTREPKPAPR